ncbi:testis-expressed protein 2 [Schistocerca americana]|uniref:testis-expressed protein 2 n=1 Tax=Schistocerca americana TaxID=7009 RepID=UPI001F4F66D6|nr:testis-expressed protein 2 [Schistocerca americana]XP_047001750.1 testis-expressed protein 2 [Schistocerca americana]XP_047001752.1 testis-expressed protein 2 [Schistocerca americana]XP_047001753.1 testis-expressed protein 2 [Schistocerca americana]
MDPLKRGSGKSITTSVPSFAIRFHADDEELEEIYPTEDVDDDSEKKGEEESQSLPPTSTVSVATTTVASTSVATTVSNTTSGTITVTSSSTAASSRDPSPMKEYLKGLGKRSTSVDVGVLDASSASGSDTWRIFHELRGKITKTVEEKISEMKSDRRSGSLSFSDIGRSSKLLGKSKENSSISDSEDISEASGKTMEQKDGAAKADPSPKRSSMEKLSMKGSSSIDEKDDPDEDSKSTTAQDEASEEGPGTPVQGETDSLSELTVPPKKLSFHAKFRSNLSGLRHRQHSHKPAIISSITMSSLASTKEDEKTENTVEDDIESGVEASEDIHVPEPVIANADPGRLDCTKFIPSSHSVQMKKKEHVFKFVGCLSWKWYIFIISYFIFNLYAPLPNFILGFVNGLLVMYMMFCLSKLFNHMFVPDGVHLPRNLEPVVIPDYSAMPILEVPPVKEYQPLTKYAGWINEYPGVYDPSTYHISETQTVYVRLEGDTLRISHPRARIPKRATWNERRHRLRFSHQRIYSIAGCEVKLLPDGLARKRLWSKKYPICIVLHQAASSVASVMKETGEEHSEFESDSTLFFDPINENSSLEAVAESDKVSATEEDEELSGELSDDDTFCHIEKSTIDHNCLYLFARTDREKEEWFRRFAGAAIFASSPVNHEEEPAVVTATQPPPSPPPPPPTPKVATGQSSSDAEVTALLSQAASSAFKSEGQLSTIPSTASITPQTLDQLNFSDYTRFMSQFDLELCEPGSSRSIGLQQSLSTHQESQLTQGEVPEAETEQDTFKESEKESQVSGSVMWINALIGRILFDILSNEYWVLKIQERIQRKLSAIKLPVFLEELLVSELDVGDTIPLIHRASLPVLDERGLWIDLDVTYQGLFCLTLETKLNLMKLKKIGIEPKSTKKSEYSFTEKRGSPMFDSDLDDSAESSEEESEVHNKSTSEEETAASQGGGTGKKILRMVSRIAASRYFQQATEYKYIKKAMEEVSNTRLLLSVELRGLVGTLTLNIPPPPSDRLWYGFRENPKIWLSARPKFGERRVNISHVIAWIEKKLLEEFQKKFVLPNMDDLVIPPMTTTLPYQEPQSRNKPQ